MEEREGRGVGDWPGTGKGQAAKRSQDPSRATSRSQISGWGFATGECLQSIFPILKFNTNNNSENVGYDLMGQFFPLNPHNPHNPHNKCLRRLLSLCGEDA